MLQENKKKRLKASEAKLSLIISVVILGFIFVSFENYGNKLVMHDVTNEVTRGKSDFQKQLTQFISRQLLQFEFLQSSEKIEVFTNSLITGKDTNKTLHSLFSNYLNAHPEAYQIRIISLRKDDMGRELVKVTRNKAQIIDTRNSELQSKISRSYFGPSAELKQGEYFVSLISLNRENGLIELPTKTTLRLSTPLFSKEQQKVGFLIVNIDLNSFFDSFASALPEYASLMITSTLNEVMFHSEAEQMNKIQSTTPVLLNQLYSRGEVTSKGFSWVKTESEGAKEFHMYHELLPLNEQHSTATVNAYMLADKTHFTKLMNQKRLVFYPIIMLLLLGALWFILKFYRSSRQHELLAIARKQTDAYVQSSSNPIIIFDDELKLMSLNDRAVSLFEFKRENTEGQKISELLETSQSKWQTTILESLLPIKEDNKEVSIFESEQQLWFTLKVKRVSSAEGVFAAEYQDITIEINAQKKLQRINSELEKRVQERTKQLSKLTENAHTANQLKSRFISSVSHEMRTPLNGLLGAITVLGRTDHEPNIQKYLNIALASGNQLSALINDVLDISKIESGKMKLTLNQFELLPVVEQVLDSFALLAREKRIKLLVDTADLSVKSIHSDRQRFIQVLNNLLSNAIKFTERGHVLIKLKSMIEQETDFATISISVHDTGIGISQKSQEKLFDYFVQAEDKVSTKFDGTGLGLVITQHLCKLMNGGIKMESDYGVGSTFEATICTNKWISFGAVRHNVLKKWTFEVVTDDNALNDSINRMLHMLGGTLLSRAEEASRVAPENEKRKPHVIVVDDASMAYPQVSKEYDANANRLATRLVTISNNAIPFAIENEYDDLLTLALPVKESDLIRAARHSFKYKKQTSSPVQRESKTRVISRLNEIVTGKHVVIVDDNDINIEVAKSLLSSLPITCHSASNGREAIEVIKALEQNNIICSSVLMDCFMPEMNGYEAAKNIRDGLAGENNKSVPIIAMTANAIEGNKEKCMESGMTGYLTKPLNESSLVENVCNSIFIHHQYQLKQQH